MEGSSKEEKESEMEEEGELFGGKREGDSEGSGRKCGGMRMDRLKGGGRLNRRVVFDRGITA